MITHTLHIGEYVFDDYDKRGGYISLINGEEKDLEVNEENRDAMVLLMDSPTFKESVSEWETLAEDCYQICEGKKFGGAAVCFEHRRDEMQTDYPYFCPTFDENCFEVELDN